MSDEHAPGDRPIMIYDGDCSFCRRWVARCRVLTGDRVAYAPSQEAAGSFPQIPAGEFQRAVQVVEPDGRVLPGAAGIFRALDEVPGRRWMGWAYRHLPGARPVCDAAYRLVAGHRRVASLFTTLLWGGHVEPPAYHLSRWLFIRLIGVVYLIAFWSLWVQVPGLIGSDGILPAAPFLAAVERYIGVDRFWRLPTLCWLGAGDDALQLLCGAGMVASGLLVAGVLPPVMLAGLWAIYLSLVNVGQDFLSFQWDALLLEAGLLAVFVAPWQVFPRPEAEKPPPAAFLWLVRWLLFRLMVLSGLTKLVSGDATWRGLTALNYHYETQPLPTALAWHAHQLPEWFQRSSVLIMFVIEIGVPLLIFGPRRLKQAAFFLLAGLQALIAATGNYCFFNLLTVVLCIPLLDDAFLRRCLPRRWAGRFPATWIPGPPWRWRRLPAALLAVLLGLAATLEAWEELGGASLPRPVVACMDRLRPFRSINGYGLFRVMTTHRPEILLEGSADGVTWQEYGFRWKPGDAFRRPGFNAPHQPRLDWQMWFAALSAPERPPWFMAFARRVLEGSPEVLNLLGSNPFPDRPPVYLRAQLYDYHFTRRSETEPGGPWWRRELADTYLPPVSLRPR
jgi:predicted DCC family thiol-disulfide oxidoreductase YuxK